MEAPKVQMEEQIGCLRKQRAGGMMDPPAAEERKAQRTHAAAQQQTDHCKRRPIDSKFLALLLDQSELH
jgi:hypothetical protein